MERSVDMFVFVIFFFSFSKGKKTPPPSLFFLNICENHRNSNAREGVILIHKCLAFDGFWIIFSSILSFLKDQNPLLEEVTCEKVTKDKKVTEGVVEEGQ